MAGPLHVMAGLDPAIQDANPARVERWMAGSSPAMTKNLPEVLRKLQPQSTPPSLKKV